MIVYKFWTTNKRISKFYPKWRITEWEGWFLFGIIPLYARKLKEKEV